MLLRMGLSVHHLRQAIASAAAFVWSLDFSKSQNSGYVGAIL